MAYVRRGNDGHGPRVGAGVGLLAGVKLAVSIDELAAIIHT